MTTRFLPALDRNALTLGIIRIMQEQLTAWEADESDPGVYWADETSEMLIGFVDDVNAAAAATWIFTAEKPAIYDLLREVDITVTAAIEALPVETLRDMFFEAWRALAPHTPEYLLFRIKQVAPTIASLAWAYDFTSRELDFYLAHQDGTPVTSTDADQAETIAAITALLDTENFSPPWLSYALGNTGTVNFDVTGTVTYSSFAPNPEAAVRDALDAALLALRRVGQYIYPSYLVEAMWQYGVIRIQLTVPAARTGGDTSVPVHGTIALTFTPADEAPPQEPTL